MAAAFENRIGTTHGVGDGLRASLDALENAGICLVEDSFWGLVEVVQHIVDLHYPRELMESFPNDPGSKFAIKLHDALDELERSRA